MGLGLPWGIYGADFSSLSNLGPTLPICCSASESRSRPYCIGRVGGRLGLVRGHSGAERSPAGKWLRLVARSRSAKYKYKSLSELMHLYLWNCCSYVSTWFWCIIRFLLLCAFGCSVTGSELSVSQWRGIYVGIRPYGSAQSFPRLAPSHR